ncbi:MAG: cell division protein FtsQ/DivIB [Bacteroidia bacterium]
MEKLKKIQSRMAQLKKLLLAGILFVLLCILASFAAKQNKTQTCSKVLINITDEEEYQFLNKKDVYKAVNDNGSILIKGKKTAEIDLLGVEKRLLRNPFVKQAQAYIDLKGQLKVEVSQRVPVMRVINPAREGYYLDKEGKRMPLSSSFAAFVPLATPGYMELQVQEKDSVLKIMDSSLFVLSQFMQQDSFARALTGQIIIEPNNEFTLIPRLGNFKIFLGDVSDLDDKFTRLKSFYKTSLPQAGWHTYNRISLKYKNQIIANL